MSHHQYMCWTLLTGTLLVGCGTEVPDGPPLPRPDPDAALDRIAAGVIRSKAKPLLQADQDPIRWKEYGDACLMNQWPEEAAVAYTQAIALGQPCGMHLAHAQRRLGNPEACQTASDSLQTNPVSERCVTLAHWYLEDGDLEQAEAWIRKADDLSSSRRAAVSMLLDIQRGELEAARTTLDPWLQGRVPSHLAQLAIQIGQATDDEALLQRFGALKATTSLVPNGPLLLHLQPLDRTKYADGNRAITIRKSFPPTESIPRLRTLIEQRPQDAFLSSVLADVLYRNQQYLKAKEILDAVIEDQPSDGEFWIIDAVVHEKIAQTAEDRFTLLARAKTSAAEAIRLNPTVPEAFMAAAQAAEAEGDHLTAERDWRKAAELSQNPRSILKLKAAAWRNVARLGESNRAADALLALAEEAGQDVPEVQLEAAVAAHLAGRLDLASELSQRLDAAYRSIYEGRIR